MLCDLFKLEVGMSRALQLDHDASVELGIVNH